MKSIASMELQIVNIWRMLVFQQYGDKKDLLQEELATENAEAFQAVSESAIFNRISFRDGVVIIEVFFKCRRNAGITSLEGSNVREKCLKFLPEQPGICKHHSEDSAKRSTHYNLPKSAIIVCVRKHEKVHDEFVGGSRNLEHVCLIHLK